MKISASLFSVKEDFVDYSEKLKYAGADYLHLDYLEGVQAPIDFFELPKFSLDIDLPMDVHLIQSRITQKDIRVLNEAKVKNLTIQYENLKNHNDIDNLKEFHGSWGIGIVVDTPLSVIKPYEKSIKHVMVMCSQPGVTGSKFNPKNISRIANINETFPNLKVQVDGGIEHLNASIMKSLKVDLIVSGSYLAKANKLFEHVYRLKYGNDDSLFVYQMMKTKLDLPCVTEDTSFVDLINTISNYKMGIAFVINKDWQLKGIVTDGDIRRAFIKFERTIFDKISSDLMNSNPFTISSDVFIYKMMEELSQCRKGITIIPVIEEDKLIGAFDLNEGV